MYSVGKQLVPFHAICSEWWEILDPDNKRFCVIVGTREDAERVVARLNSD